MSLSKDYSQKEREELKYNRPNPKETETLQGLVDLLFDLETANQDKTDFAGATSSQTEFQPQKENTFQESEQLGLNSRFDLDATILSLISSNNTLQRSPKQSLQIDLSNETKIVKEKTDVLALQQTINNLKDKIEKLENQIYHPTDIINPLIPLITELLNLKSFESRESLLQTLVPIIDDIIQQRSQQDKQKLGAALGEILPTAITHEIQTSPAEIAKAIAPEMAIAIQEQMRLDPDSMGKTLGPEMGEAIKTQIRVEQDAMVDALYPVIGNTISKYMAEVVKTINEKVESTLSVEGIKRKIRAKLKGTSEAVLILQEAIHYEIQAVFLIHKSSGLVIRELHSSPESKLDADMLAGLLTAIRSFVNECVAQPGKQSELHQIEYDSAKIILEVAGYCYIAAVIKGEPSKRYIHKLRNTLSKIVLKYGKLIAAYDGDPATIPNAIDPLLEKLTQTEKQEKSSKPPYAILAIVGIIVLVWGFILYRAHVARQVETRTSAALDAAPALSVYQILPDFHWGKLTLTGRVPNSYLKKQAGEIASKTSSNLQIDNQIIAVEIPPDPVQTAGEVERVTWIFNQKSGTSINASHDYGTKAVTIAGIVPNLNETEQITQAFKQIPGVETVTNTVQIRPILESRIYFESGSTRYSSPDISTEVKAIRQFLEQNPQVHLKIIGHTDRQGTKTQNQELGINRARIVQQALLAEQINPARLHVVANTELPPGITKEQSDRLSRCVRFEVFIPSVSK
jgi:outer membrane protein OmpA-like peptidoglycan-associated protein